MLKPMTASAAVLTTTNLSMTSPLPLLVQPVQSGLSLNAAFAALKSLVDEQLYLRGGLLFRNFAVDSIQAFQAFATAFGSPLLNYEFGSTPRSNVIEGVYTSTEYPPHQAIPLHNEQAYTREWPMKISFYCAQVAAQGGETPIADSRKIYQKIPTTIRERFARHGLMYVRNYGNGLDVPWSEVFNTTDRANVTQYCQNHGIICDWKADGELRTKQICQAVAQHPVTRDWVWFNQAHLFHVSNLADDIRETLLDVLDEEDLPRQVYYGDGSAIEDSALNEIRDVLAEETVMFPWQTGDVIMLDNMLTAHARTPFAGPRKVVVAMAEPHS